MIGIAARLAPRLLPKVAKALARSTTTKTVAQKAITKASALEKAASTTIAKAPKSARLLGKAAAELTGIATIARGWKALRTGKKISGTAKLAAGTGFAILVGKPLAEKIGEKLGVATPIATQPEQAIQPELAPAHETVGTGTPTPPSSTRSKVYDFVGEHAALMAALGLAGVGGGLGAYFGRQIVKRKAEKKTTRKKTTRKKTTRKKTTRKKTTRKKTTPAQYMKELGKKWRKMSPRAKAKYEGKFSDFVKVYMEKKFAAKR